MKVLRIDRPNERDPSLGSIQNAWGTSLRPIKWILESLLLG